MKNYLNIRDEEIFLLGLCRFSFGVELKVMLTALAETITDWDYFFSVANAHGVVALVYHNLGKLGFLNLVSDTIAQSLRNAMMVNLSRNTRNAEAMGEVLRILNHENIKTVLLKGLALELTVYGNKGLRQMTDVDVLVSRDNCIRARKLLMDNGFESLPVKSLFLKPIIADIGKHLPTLYKNGFAVELHQELFGAGKNVLTRILYDTSVEMDINGEKCFVPEAQIFFLYLVKHLYLHEMNNESQLRLYTDLVVLIEKYGDEILNYDLLTYANQAGMSQILAWRIELLRDLWGMSFPDWINEFIDKWYHPDSINKFVFFLKNPKDNPFPGKGQKFRNNIREIEGIHRKILFTLGEIFPTIEFMKKRYNCKSTFSALLRYPPRWIGL
jgi:hypothetical protein